MLLARRGGRVLRLAPPGARLGLGFGGRAHVGFGGFDRLALGVDLGADRFQLGFDVGEAVLAGEPARRAGRRVGRDREAVPAPEVAVARHQPLAGLEQRNEARRVGAVDHADLLDAARELGRGVHVLAERLDAFRQFGSSGSIAAPAQRIGEEGSIGASRSSPSAAPSAAS